MKSNQRRREHNQDSPLETRQQNALNVLQQSGQALDASTRAFLEPRFGHSFADVRVHSDAAATAALDSRAFALGQDIVLGDVNPTTPEGLEILTHELAHTVQQRFVNTKAPPSLTPTDSSLESNARAATRSVLTGGTASLSGADSAQVSRWGDDETNLAISLGLTAAGTLPGVGGVIASVAGATDAVRQAPGDNDPMRGMKNIEAGLGVGGGIVSAAAGLAEGSLPFWGAAGVGGMEAGAAVGGAGMSGAAALGPGAAVLGAGLAGMGVGHYLSEHTSVGGHTEDTVGGFDRFLTNNLLGEGSRSMTLQLDEMRQDEWDKTTLNPLTWGHGALSAGALVDEAAIGTVGALGGLGGGLVDAASWAGNGIAGGASSAYNWLDSGVRGLYGVPE